MRALAAAVIVLLILALLGWFTLFADDDEVGAAVNTDVVKEDVETTAEAAKVSGAQLNDGVEKLGDGVEKVGEEIEKTDVDIDVSRD